MLTPPVAPAAVISSKLAGAGFMRTAFEQVKPAVAGFLIPFMIIYCPVLILEPADWALSIPRLIALFAAVMSIQVGVNNFCFIECAPYERALFFMAAAVLFRASSFFAPRYA